MKYNYVIWVNIYTARADLLVCICTAS